MDNNYAVNNQSTPQDPPLKDILAKTVKTGIIKSNLIPMSAGLTLAMYTYGHGIIASIPTAILAIIGSSLIIAAAGSYNNLYERDIDSIMQRTKERPTVTGQIKFNTVLIMGIVMTILGTIALYFTTPLAALLGLVGLFFYVYPYTMWSKRHTVYNTEIGSISGAMPPLIGWAAVHPSILHPAIFGLFIITIIWQMPHFYAIAIRRHDDYKLANIPMLPVVKGIRRTYIQTNVYLILLILTSFLFNSLSLGLTLVALILAIIWLGLSIYGYHKMDSIKWAKAMFVYSLIHMTVLFSTIIIYSLVGIIFNL